METPDPNPTVRTYGTRPAEYAVVVPDDGQFRRALEDLAEATGDGGDVPAVRALLVDGEVGPDDLVGELDGLPGVAVFDTHAPVEPVAFFDRSHPEAFDLVASLPVGHAVDVHDLDPMAVFGPGPHSGLVEAGLVRVEVGDADPAAFLRAAFGSLGIEPSPTGFYVMSDPVRGADASAVSAPNFERVDAGTVFAEVDGDRLVANWPFVPVLFGECGVDGVVGYRAARVGGSVAEARAGLRPDSLE
ncbi:uncharacterized protein Nmlp_2822 [Natronomonas moolapensis 8.8.11]|uniref:Uncharacterized protein n=1 Tax=Natronomonas moolapensis (strain DSM 18674 / CECT 7526 / JCM 14361 / 8.8.11) TaxID=268739 RepID=M1XRS3_NATM8|nr:hypothetical protein [Natronomonas moolapensis]CCQ36974.1 uncharacterized protein Nmlp_2822 [Natronomonas moolapensis 8.8.11]